MKKLTSREICDLLDILIGNTKPAGDTAIDEVREQNLKTLIDIGNWVFDGVMVAAEFCTSPMYSRREMGMRAKGAMFEWRDWLSYQLEEFEDVDEEEHDEDARS